MNILQHAKKNATQITKKLLTASARRCIIRLETCDVPYWMIKSDTDPPAAGGG